MAEEIAKPPPCTKQYDYLLKFLLVGDSDVGKQEILSDLDDGSSESPFCGHSGKCTCCENSVNILSNIPCYIAYKTTTILLDGKRVKLQLWDTSGQGRFCTIIRSYSRGAQGVLLVYDITNRWSFDGLDRWLKEVDEHAPGVPKVLVGNRLHLAFNRKVGLRDALQYANKHNMAFFEVSPLCNFNIHESFCELSRMALQRNGMERLWRSNKGKYLQTLYFSERFSDTPSNSGIFVRADAARAKKGTSGLCLVDLLAYIKRLHVRAACSFVVPSA